MQFSAKVPSLTSRPLWISFGEVLLGDTSVAIRLFTSSIVSVGSSRKIVLAPEVVFTRSLIHFPAADGDSGGDLSRGGRKDTSAPATRRGSQACARIMSRTGDLSGRAFGGRGIVGCGGDAQKGSVLSRTRSGGSSFHNGVRRV
jgi:hypothetical protein